MFALFWQCGIFALFRQCGIFALFRQCGIFASFRQCGIFALFRQCGIFALFRQCGSFVFHFIASCSVFISSNIQWTEVYDYTKSYIYSTTYSFLMHTRLSFSGKHPDNKWQKSNCHTITTTMDPYRHIKSYTFNILRTTNNSNDLWLNIDLYSRVRL